MTSNSDLQQLLTAEAVRDRAHQMLALAREGKLLHWRLHEGQLEACAGYVLDTIRARYPALDIPFHARWRHFQHDGLDQWYELAVTHRWGSARAKAVAACDLAIVSVLLDAGAGPDWSYQPLNGGSPAKRSEGLGLASLDMFRFGLFSDVEGEPYRVDAVALTRLDAEALAIGFQADRPGNAMVGLEGRAALLNRLGEHLIRRDGRTGDAERMRPGAIFDQFATIAKQDGSVDASTMLAAVLERFGPIWRDDPAWGGVPLGDTWRHPLIDAEDGSAGYVPFHKLSQWLTYSLIEPTVEAGVAVEDIDGLTGLPEYRNGGLFMDMGVISLRDPGAAGQRHEVGSTLVVEWRALTVALLDLVAERIRAALGMNRRTLPLAKVLEGGTWAAGRRIAAEKREGGGPPLAIISDGTVF